MVATISSSDASAIEGARATPLASACSVSLSGGVEARGGYFSAGGLLKADASKQTIVVVVVRCLASVCSSGSSSNAPPPTRNGTGLKSAHATCAASTLSTYDVTATPPAAANAGCSSAGSNSSPKLTACTTLTIAETIAGASSRGSRGRREADARLGGAAVSFSSIWM